MEKLIILQGLSLDALLKEINLIVEQRLQQVLDKMEPPKQTRYMTRKEVCGILHVSLTTLHYWTKFNIVKAYKIGNRVLYKQNEIEEALAGSRTLKHKRGMQVLITPNCSDEKTVIYCLLSFAL